MEIRQPEKRYDVVIAGGGLVGGSFALMLAGLCAGGRATHITGRRRAGCSVSAVSYGAWQSRRF